jgi:hypothetical protein
MRALAVAPLAPGHGVVNQTARPTATATATETHTHTCQRLEKQICKLTMRVLPHKSSKSGACRAGTTLVSPRAPTGLARQSASHSKAECIKQNPMQPREAAAGPVWRAVLLDVKCSASSASHWKVVRARQNPLQPREVAVGPPKRAPLLDAKRIASSQARWAPAVA